MVIAEAGVEVHLQEGLCLIRFPDVFVRPYGGEELEQGHGGLPPLGYWTRPLKVVRPARRGKDLTVAASDVSVA